ncbi:hypothetical protein HNY73_010836 [Argiope bruennichi]|uniref:Uncharacterized protein n=1 Tax=Argiope bruennichi TaxID=94029 RepID=A0A8T0F283_ARGBR|nr:hypothetical protein HNY73_010836 [Argiope bruennichi]
MADCPTQTQDAATDSKNVCNHSNEKGKYDAPKLSNEPRGMNSVLSLSDEDEIIFFPFSRDRSFADNVAACKTIIKATLEAMSVIENCYAISESLITPN